MSLVLVPLRSPRPPVVGVWVSYLASWPDVLLFATLFIFGDKKVVHDVSRQEAGRNQAGARRGAAFAMPLGDPAMELVVSENFVPTMPPSWTFLLGLKSFLEFKSNNNTPSSCYATDKQTRQRRKGKVKKKKKKTTGDTRLKKLLSRAQWGPVAGQAC